MMISQKRQHTNKMKKHLQREQQMFLIVITTELQHKIN